MVSTIKLNKTTLWEKSEFICDSADDLTQLPKIPEIAPGSTALIINSAGLVTYMLSNKGVWIKI